MTGRILVATRNPGKLRELQVFFAALGAALVDLDAAGIPESAEEDSLEAFPTFEANALAKARYFRVRTGLPTVADDSGLVVDALDGAPGVHSRRYSGATGDRPTVDSANNEKLMRALDGVANRQASFVCAAAFVSASRELVVRGEARGRIAEVARGSGGFGYDPYFVSDELGVTFAEAGLAEKERVSHRGRAFRALIEAIGSVDALRGSD